MGNAQWVMGNGFAALIGRTWNFTPITHHSSLITVLQEATCY